MIDPDLQDQKFLEVAEKCMETGLGLFDHTDSWHKEVGHSVESGRVVSKSFKGLGKVCKLQVRVATHLHFNILFLFC